jgi:hypothetical protein
MMSDNRAVFMQILNQNKDKMTSEQFWCVALISGGMGALILNQEAILIVLPSWLVAIFALIVASWGLFYIYYRHKGYADLQRAFVRMIEWDKDAPECLKQIPVSFREERLKYIRREFLPGYGAYAIIILALSIVVCVLYLA